MVSGDLRSRRAVLSAVGAGAVTVLSGCAKLTGSGGNENEEPNKVAKPVLENAVVNITNFRKTSSMSKTIALVRNDGELGEVRLRVRARGDVAVYDEQTELFSLRSGQKYQAGVELFTHEGAKKIDIMAESTASPENSDSVTITPEDKQYISYRDNSNSNS
jgi:hypothetical protein